MDGWSEYSIAVDYPQSSSSPQLMIADVVASLLKGAQFAGYWRARPSPFPPRCQTSSNLGVDAIHARRILDTACATLVTPMLGSTAPLKIRGYWCRHMPASLLDLEKLLDAVLVGFRKSPLYLAMRLIVTMNIKCKTYPSSFTLIGP